MLRSALARYEDCGRVSELDSGFAAATALIVVLRDPGRVGPPDVEELRRLQANMPELGELLRAAGDEAERTMRAGSRALWAVLDLHSEPPGWEPAERQAAELACACALTPGVSNQRLRTGLTKLASARWAALLLDEFARAERVWVRALGDRYPPVRHRCAPRTRWRDVGLAPLARGDERSRQELGAALTAWLSGGGDLRDLAATLEAALVHARTPARLA